MQVGRYSYGAGSINVEFGNPANLKIGSFCSIAANLTCFLGGNHRIDWVTTFPFGHIFKDVFNTFDGTGHPHSKGGIVIGNDVWIGKNVTILSGVTIGSGAVIGLNSTVTKDVPPYSVVAGNPAKFIKYRFTAEQIADLLDIAWWDWKSGDINKLVPILCSTDVDGFIAYCKQWIEEEKNMKVVDPKTSPGDEKEEDIAALQKWVEDRSKMAISSFQTDDTNQ
jgi:acetyltransferase-like isoleucine patch superfamily enzyme